MPTLKEIRQACPLFFRKDQEKHCGTYRYTKKGNVVFTHNRRPDLNNGEPFIKAWLFDKNRLHPISEDGTTYISPDGTNDGYQKVRVNLENGEICKYIER